MLGVNLRAAFFAAQAAARHMRTAGSVRIVNVSSQAAAVAIPSYLSYGVSKAGLEAMNSVPRRRARRRRDPVNAVAPAFVRTDTRRADGRTAAPRRYEDQLARVPKRRMGTVEEGRLLGFLPRLRRGADFHHQLGAPGVDGGYLAFEGD